MIEDVAVYIAENTDLRIGRTLFKGNEPDAPTDLVLVTDTGGAPPWQESPMDLPTVQVVCRGRQNAYTATMARAMEIFDLLNRKLNLTIGAKNVAKVEALTSPQSLGLDEKRRWKIVINFAFHLRRT